MKMKQSNGSIIFDIVNVIFMVFMILICFYPFYYVLVCSFSSSSFLLGNKGFILWPKGFSLNAYKAVMNNLNILSGYKMTISVLVLGTAINIALTSLGAFVVTRKKFKPAKIMLKLMIFTMYFSGGMIPTYLLINNGLGISNTIWSLVLPGAISTYNLIIMKTNFAAIPDSLEESACIDGANDFIIFFKIVMPLSIPVIMVMVLFYGVAHWNAWFNAMLYINDRSRYPLQLILREILLLGNVNDMVVTSDGETYTIAESIRYATIIVATLPVLLVYPSIQKYFVKGMMIGAVKG